MIDLGNLNIDNVKLGGDQVDKVMVGSEQVWPVGPVVLPYKAKITLRRSGGLTFSVTGNSAEYSVDNMASWVDMPSGQTINVSDVIFIRQKSGGATITSLGLSNGARDIITIDHYDGTGITQMYGAFQGADHMTRANVINISGSANMKYMFNGCLVLTDICGDIDTTQSSNRDYMFNNCHVLAHPTASEQADLIDSSGAVYSYSCP